MSIRNIDIMVSSVEEQEKESRWAGMQYEDNATLVRFIVDEALLGSFGDSAVFRIDFNGTESGYSPSENLQGEEGIFSRLLPYSMTYIGEDIEAVLVVSDQNFEILTYPVTLRFTEVERDGVSEPAINSNISLMEESVKKMCDRTCAAAEDVDGMYSELREIYVPANEMLNAKNEAEELVRTVEQKLENGEFVGEQGPVGPEGPQGIQGATGPIGPQGVQGEQGPQGAKGEKGDRGEQGIQGEKGDKGDKGEKGDTGAAGKDAVTDQTFDPESENAQSGIAVAEAIEPIDRAYEFIESISVTEELTKINLTTEADGTPYNFKKLFMKYNLPQLSATTWLTFRIGSGNAAFGDYMGHPSYATIYRFEARVENGLLSAEFSYHTNSEQNPSNAIKCLARNIRSTPIDRLVIEGAIPVGTTFEIWGVRA